MRLEVAGRVDRRRPHAGLALPCPQAADIGYDLGLPDRG